MNKDQHKLLLLRLFDRLRTELSLPLGIGEYQLLLDALEKGQGLRNSRSLLTLCETIWIKTKEDREILGDMLKQLMQEEVAIIDELVRKKTEEANKKIQEEKQAEKEKAEKSRDRSLNLDDKEKQEEDKQEDKADKKPLENQQKPENVTQRSEQEEEIGVVLDLPIDDGQKKAEVQLTDTFILTDTYLPLSIREMKQIWRMLRHSAKGGFSDEIDIPATVKAIAEEGIVIHPVFQSDRVNKIQLILFVDHDGSMVAFNSLTRNLIDSAMQGGGHAQASVYYFNNCPIDHVYTSPNHIKHEALSKIYTKTSSVYTVAMIISDAGAARGTYSPERVAQTQVFLEELKNHVARVSWFNPMPRHRWGGTSAYFIADMVPMFELMGEMKRSHLGEKLEKIDNRKGMEQVINILQGKRV